jgi:hypothetical protein
LTSTQNETEVKKIDARSSQKMLLLLTKHLGKFEMKIWQPFGQILKNKGGSTVY